MNSNNFFSYRNLFIKQLAEHHNVCCQHITSVVSAFVSVASLLISFRTVFQVSVFYHPLMEKNMLSRKNAKMNDTRK